MSKSVLQNTKECWACHSPYNLQEHHVIYGTANRKKSEQFGLKVWLCWEHHTGNKGVHNGNKQLDLDLHRLAQRKFEETHTREEFIKTFGRSFL